MIGAAAGGGQQEEVHLFVGKYGKYLEIRGSASVVTRRISLESHPIEKRFEEIGLDDVLPFLLLPQCQEKDGNDGKDGNDETITTLNANILRVIATPNGEMSIRKGKQSTDDKKAFSDYLFWKEEEASSSDPAPAPVSNNKKKKKSTDLPRPPAPSFYSLKSFSRESRGKDKNYLTCESADIVEWARMQRIKKNATTTTKKRK